MKEVSKTNGGSVPALPDAFAAKLLGGIIESRAQTATLGGGGKPFMRMMKSGDWVFGPSNEEVQDGSPWAANIVTLAHGYSCWVDAGGKNELRGEVMVSMTEPKPAKPLPIDGTPFQEQRSFELKCMDGADEGTEVLYKTNSVGGMNAVDGFLAVIQRRLGGTEHERQYCCPVIQLGRDYYDHKKWGRIYTPLLNVVGWCDMGGNMDPGEHPTLPLKPAPAAAAEPAPAPAPRRATKAPLSAKTEPTAAAAPPPPSTQQAHAGQRRRPAAR